LDRRIRRPRSCSLKNDEREQNCRQNLTAPR
jgi:hypothetical protein